MWLHLHLNSLRSHPVLLNYPLSLFNHRLVQMMISQVEQRCKQQSITSLPAISLMFVVNLKPMTHSHKRCILHLNPILSFLFFLSLIFGCVSSLSLSLSLICCLCSAPRYSKESKMESKRNYKSTP
jgi:hypothetical protein